MDFVALNWLSSAPNKKYIRKLLEFAYLFRNKLHSFQEYMETPVSSQMSQDLQLNEKQTHQLIFAMVELIETSEKLSWNAEQIAQLFPESFSEQLQQLLVENIVQISPLCDKITNREICQADSLVDIDWRLDVQIQSHNQSQVNQPVLFLQLETLNSQTNQKNNVVFQLNSNEVNNFYLNLKKIKDQLSSLVSP